MQNRFVIHQHSGYGPLHFDLMLARQSTLATWQLSQNPLLAEMNQPLAAKKLPDHRWAYLDYEGPVSRGRGEVTAVYKGTYVLIEENHSRWLAKLFGQNFSCLLELTHLGPAGEDWQMKLLAGPASLA